MDQQYSLSGDVLSVGGNNIDEMVKKTIGAHYNIALAVIIVLAIVIVILLFKKESFMPGSTMRYVRAPMSGSEAMEHGRETSRFAQQVQTDFVTPSNWYTPSGAMVLSEDAAAFCSDAGKPNDDAWAWMGMAARSGQDAAPAVAQTEQMTGKKNLVAVMNGY